jgi:tRNA nucleotidyltransferase/poly(A) polymerase
MRPFVLRDVLESLYMQLYVESYIRKDNDSGLDRRKMTENEATIEEMGKLGRKLTAEVLIEKLDKILKGKRCLIVLDDLSSLGECGMIIRSLPKMNSMCRIVITTREENIARHCSQKQENIYKLKVLEDRDALDLFTKKVMIQYNRSAFVLL